MHDLFNVGCFGLLAFRVMEQVPLGPLLGKQNIQAEDVYSAKNLRKMKVHIAV